MDFVHPNIRINGQNLGSFWWVGRSRGTLGVPGGTCLGVLFWVSGGSVASGVGGGGLVCLERGVVPWVHEIDPLIGWRVRDRVPALGAFVPPSW